MLGRDHGALDDQDVEAGLDVVEKKTGVPVERAPPHVSRPRTTAIESAALVHRQEGPFLGPVEHLTGPGDPLLGIVQQLLPLSEPPDGARAEIQRAVESCPTRALIVIEKED